MENKFKVVGALVLLCAISFFGKSDDNENEQKHDLHQISDHGLHGEL